MGWIAMKLYADIQDESTNFGDFFMVLSEMSAGHEISLNQWNVSTFNGLALNFAKYLNN